MGVGDDGGEPVQVVTDGDFGDGHAFVSVEEAEDFAVDFFGREGLGHILHGQGVESGKVIGVQDGDDDGVWSEGGAALGQGVEAFQVGHADRHLMLPGASSGSSSNPSARNADKFCASETRLVFETAVGVAQLVADLAEGGAEILRVTLVNVGKERVEPFELVDDEQQGLVDFMFGLCGREAALRREFFGGAGEPVVIHEPFLNLVNDVAAITRNMVGGFQGMIGGSECLGVVVELQAEKIGNIHLFCGAFHVAADVLVQFVQSAHNLADVLVGL